MPGPRCGLGDEFAVLVLGRIAFQKGQDLLVPAWEALRPDGMILYLVGPGDVATSRRSHPSTWGRSIRFIGGTDDVRPWLWAVDVLVLRSRYETVALVIAEAMAAGYAGRRHRGRRRRRRCCSRGTSRRPDRSIPLGTAGLSSRLSTGCDETRSWPAPTGRQARLAPQTRFAPGLVAERLEAAYRTAIAARRRNARMTIPTFLVVGAARCGTTGLVEGLRSHPRVFVTDPKEPHYFALHRTRRRSSPAPGDAHTINRVAVTDRDAYLALYPAEHDYARARRRLGVDHVLRPRRRSRRSRP